LKESAASSVSIEEGAEGGGSRFFLTLVPVVKLHGVIPEDHVLKTIV
jgi:hypothetical protein